MTREQLIADLEADLSMLDGCECSYTGSVPANTLSAVEEFAADAADFLTVQKLLAHWNDEDPEWTMNDAVAAALEADWLRIAGQATGADRISFYPKWRRSHAENEEC